MPDTQFASQEYNVLAVVKSMLTGKLGIIFMKRKYYYTASCRADSCMDDYFAGLHYFVWFRDNPEETDWYGVASIEALSNEDDDRKAVAFIKNTPDVNPFVVGMVLIDHTDWSIDTASKNIRAMLLPRREPYRTQYLNAWNENIISLGFLSWYQNEIKEDD